METNTGSRRHLKGFLITIAAAMVYGLWPNCIRGAYADGANATLAILITTAARMLTLTLFCVFAKKRLFATKEDRKLALRGGFFQALAMSTAIAAAVWLPGPVVITLTFTHTIMLLFFLAWKGKVRLDALTVASTITAFIGLTFVLNIWSVEEPVSVIGAALALFSALATMSRLYVFGERTKTQHPAVVGAETFIVGMAFVCLIPLFLPPAMPATLAGWGWLALGSFSLSAGNFAMFFAISMIGSFRFSLLLKMEPVFTALFSVLLIGEVLGAHQYLGIALVIGSLSAYQYMEHRKNAAKPA